jgi:hypothetical protein
MRIVGLVIALFCLIVGLSLLGQFVETNDAGYVQVKQAAGSGELTVRTEPGMYAQNFGTITTYKVSDVYDFNSDRDKIDVRFNDASTARISGQIKFRLPLAQDSILRIHKEFRSYDAVESGLIRQVVAAAIKQSATFFRAADVYSSKRAEFIDRINDQIKDGIYATDSYKEEIKDEIDPTKTKVVEKVEIKLGADGRPIVNEVSGFRLYGVELVQIVINDIDFDDKTDAFVAERRDLEQKRISALASAETAKQNAITAVEQGKADVAKAEAESLVIAKRATVEAEKNTKVAQQLALQAEENKKAIISKGEADAAATKLKVAAGLSPYEKAEFDMKTAIGVASSIAGVKFPSVMVIGGKDASGSGQVNPFDAIGIEALINISKKLSTNAN